MLCGIFIDFVFQDFVAFVSEINILKNPQAPVFFMSRGEHCQLAWSILDGTRHGELDIRYIKEAIHQGPGEPKSFGDYLTHRIHSMAEGSL